MGGHHVSQPSEEVILAGGRLSAIAAVSRHRPTIGAVVVCVTILLSFGETTKPKGVVLTKGDQMNQARERSRELRLRADGVADPIARHVMKQQAGGADSLVNDLAWDSLTNDDPRYSEPVIIDSGLASLVVKTLLQIKVQVDKELKRDDLYPNIRDQLFKRRRALEDVVKLFQGDRREGKLPLEDTNLLVVEFEDDSMDVLEVPVEDADIAEAQAVSQGGVVTRYHVVPYGGSDVWVQSPLREIDNFFKPLPPDILNRVIHSSKGRVRLPEGFVLPDVPAEVRDYLRLGDGDGGDE